MRTLALLLSLAFLVGLVALGVLGLVTWVGGDDDDEDTVVTEATTTEEAVGGGGDVIEVSMTEYAFKPKDLTVSQGDTITVKNDGQIPHNYSVLGGPPGAPARKREIGPSTPNIDPGSSGELIPEPAEFICGDCEVICTIPGHAKQGMRGTLTVRKG
jgi:uncharacterized cupredoxin-like copper-binding protein